MIDGREWATRAPERMELRVLRFDNLQVLKETGAVVEAIWVVVGEVLGKSAR